MYNPFKSFTQQIFPHFLGVDIGTTSIKVVEVRQGSRRPTVSNYGFLESSAYLAHDNRALQTSSLKLFEEEVIELLKVIVKQMKPATNVALASLPSFSAFTTVLDLPEMPPNELQNAMIFQARQYIPQPLSEVALDWLKVSEYQDEKGFKHQQVLLISVPQDNIKKYQVMFKKAGLELRALEIESLSIARVLVGSDTTPTIIVDIGSRSTNIAFVDKGQLRYNSQSDFAGAALTQSLASSLNVNPLRAEELKKERGIVGQGANYELSTVMLPFVDAIINEVKKAHFNYQTQFPTAPKIERVILSGGGANLLGIDRYFQSELQLPIVKAAPFSKFEYPAAIEPLVEELNPLMSVALGLTLREFA